MGAGRCQVTAGRSNDKSSPRGQNNNNNNNNNNKNTTNATNHSPISGTRGQNDNFYKVVLVQFKSKENRVGSARIMEL